MPKSPSKARVSSSIKIYRCDQLEAADNTKKRLPALVESVIDLIDDAKSDALSAEKFLLSTPTKTHVTSGRPLTKAFRKKLQNIQHRILGIRSFILEVGEINFPEDFLENYVYKLVDAVKIILDTAESLSDFPGKRSKAMYYKLCGSLAEFLDELGETRNKLAPVITRTNVVTVPDKQHLVSELDRLELPVVPEQTSSRPIVSFLDDAYDRGWKIANRGEIQRQLAAQNIAEDEVIQIDDFSHALDILGGLQKPTSDLLDTKTEFGIATFPIISKNRRHLPKSLIQKLIDPRVGYSLYFVFGDYMIIDQMHLFGIHHSVIKQDDGSLDTGQFNALFPEIRTKLPDLKALDLTQPIFPTKSFGEHYYCPLLPSELLARWGAGISDWQFLSTDFVGKR